MKLIIAEGLSQYKDDILSTLKKFKSEGTLIGNGSRNVIKIFDVNGMHLNFKSFKQHNIINRHVYKFYRKSKAHRSFEYAHMLISKNYHTPRPVAYIENHDFIGLTSSYYITEQLEDVWTLDRVIYDHSFADREEIIKEYTRLMFSLHNDGIQFLDNSPNNFLIRKEDNKYSIYLVDLNRMNFYDSIHLDKRLKNFARLTNSPEVIEIIAEEYAHLYGTSKDICLKSIMQAAQKQVTRRKIKKVLKLYKYLIPKFSNH
ncbi:lipopolysaccharide kinase [Chryseobacterium shandongense]|uniref:Lipopolysaccharide kinase n=1 Tax=Chryseobacterium shandongense TaxID=1493872 RepID=A0AAD0YCV1_9FLAO|nr:lipopolysaccharide kinase InaA family protein [Chryseobacterium shandongense]AZA86127.1 lipopolysaccharide kinase [Chryseobacterium shandongense]AZA94538.1 lipopolysaccharide kinase [Chryseobacterium shandongense]